LNKLKRKD